MRTLRRLLREPVVHFLLIGLVLFLTYGRLRGDRAEGSRIVITQALVDELVRQHEARWTRPPTADELRGLVDAYVHDEILYREGVALGLERDDAVIKRRVRQKLDVMAEEALGGAAPSDAELSAYLSAHADRFKQPAVVSFEQVFLGADLAGATLADVARTARTALDRGQPPSATGTSTLLRPGMTDTPADLVAREFGESFAQAVVAAPIGAWSGPVASPFGHHLVRVSARTAPAVPSLDAVRAAVAREWENDRRARALRERDAALRRQYDVVVEAVLSPRGTS